MTPANDSEPLLNEREVARRLGVSVATTRRWRMEGQGPRYVKVSKSAVRYRPEDLRAYLDARPTGGATAQRPGR
jgi:predicted DNA-binding transcriptional regulator AlpA